LGFSARLQGEAFSKFCVAFSKATAHPTRGALVAARTRRNILLRAFFFAKRESLVIHGGAQRSQFSFAPTLPKKKADKQFKFALCRKENFRLSVDILNRFPLFF
jgi:hypothetical protein